MRPFTSTISIDEARRRLDAGVRPIARVETIPLAHAAGRVAAADVTSTMDVPLNSGWPVSGLTGFGTLSVPP